MKSRFSTASSLNRSPLTVRVVVFVGVFCFVTPIDASAQGTQWDGSTTSAWRTADNWSKGIPDAAKNTTVSVDSTVPGRFNLIVPAPLSGDTARVANLTISESGLMQFAPSPSPGILIVHGSVLSLNGGVLQLGDGTILFKGDVQLNGGGELQVNSGTLEFQGNITAQNGATFVPGTGTVIFSGAGDQSISGDLQFFDLVVETGGTLSLSGSISVSGTVVVEEGSTLVVENGTAFVYEGAIVGGGDFVDQNVLAVQLTGFSAALHGNDVLLEWATATEEGNFGFNVERRSITAFGDPSCRQVGFVHGAGTSTSPREYSFVDPAQAAGRCAYRLVQIDFDGTMEVFHEAEVQVLAPDHSGIHGSYPNPFNPRTLIDYSIAQDSPVRLSVFDIRGREVAVLVNELRPAGMYQVEWSATHMPSGTYIARMESNGRWWTKQLLLLK